MIRPTLCAAFLMLLAVASLSLGSFSGFYVDNGIDQTVRQRRLSPQDAESIGLGLLELLDLPCRPQRRKRKLMALHRSASQYLLDIYNKLNDGEHNDGDLLMVHRPFGHVGYDASWDTNDIPDTEESTRTSNWVITFVNKKHHVAEIHHKRGTELWFDVSHVPKDSDLILGVLRIFQEPKLSKWKKDVGKYVISVFTISEFKGDQQLQPLTTANTTSDYRGWLELNVTDAFDNWLNASTTNLGLYIDAYSIYRPDYRVKLSDIGLVKADGDIEHQPFMVGYFRKTKRSGKYPRLRRDTSSSRRRPIYDYDDYTGLYNEIFMPELQKKEKACQLSSLFVSFQDLNWQDWIVAPNGYGASFCGGECDFPLTFNMNATNHAIVQMLVHLTDPKAIPKPLCAPTKLIPISVLYFAEDSNINLKTFPDMVVEQCGCH